MRNRIVRYLLTSAATFGLAGTPALFAGNPGYDRYDLHQDYNHLARQNADIRADQWRLHEDVEHGRFGMADRERADLNRDYYQRGRQVRDIRHDQRDIRRDGFYRNDCR